jgi:hypothetical protein
LIFLCNPRQDLPRPATKSQVVSLNITLWRPYAVSMHSATDCRRPYHSKYLPSPLDRLLSQLLSLCAQECGLAVQLFWTQQCVATGSELYLPAWKLYWIRYEQF